MMSCFDRVVRKKDWVEKIMQEAFTDACAMTWKRQSKKWLVMQDRIIDEELMMEYRDNFSNKILYRSIYTLDSTPSRDLR